MTFHTRTPQARERRAHYRTYLRGLVILSLLAGMLTTYWLALAITLAGAYDSDQNQPDYWGDDCYKDDTPSGGPSVYLDADYRLVVLKSGTVNDVFDAPRAGDVLTTRSGRDISHVIYCEGTPDVTTTTTEPPTTTVPPTTTTEAPCAEDDPCWDCETMGNRRCGPPPTTTRPPATTTAPPVTIIDPCAAQLLPDGTSYCIDPAPPAIPVPAAPRFTG